MNRKGEEQAEFDAGLQPHVLTGLAGVVVRGHDPPEDLLMIRSASHRCDDRSTSATETPRTASPDSLPGVAAGNPARRSHRPAIASRATSGVAIGTAKPEESPLVRFMVVRLRRDGIDVAGVAKATGLPRYRVRSLLRCAAAAGLLPYCRGRDAQFQIRRRRRAITADAAASPSPSINA